MKNDPTQPRSFWQEFLRVIGIDAVVVLVLVLILGQDQLSNMLFFSTIVFLVIAIIPIFSDIDQSAKEIRAMKRKGERKEKEEKKDGIKELGKIHAGSRTTFVYGLTAIVTFILSVFTSNLGR